MFCYNCGSKLDDKAVICPHCGVQVRTLSADPAAFDEPDAKRASVSVTQSNVSPAPQPAKADSENTLAIVGFILSFFVPIAGLICSIIGLKKASRGAPYKGLAVAGVVISAVSLGIVILTVMSYGCFICSLCAAMPVY